MAILGAESRRVSGTAVSAFLIQGISDRISCVIRMHGMNLKVFLGGDPIGNLEGRRANVAGMVLGKWELK